MLLLFVYSKACNEKSFVDWADQEAKRVELEAQAKMQIEDAISTFSEGADEPSFHANGHTARDLS